MSSGNAFAQSLTGLPINGINGNGVVERPTKRPRLSEDATAAIETQCAQEDTSVEVDHMILDYLAYQTIKACFSSRNLEQHGVSIRSLANNLATSDAFLSIFKARHPTYKPDPELRLRVLLLKLATLFTQRMTSNPTTPSRPALQDLRNVNHERARRWIGTADRIPSAAFDTSIFDGDLGDTQQRLERSRAHVLHELGVPAEDEDYEDAFYGTSSSVSLLDILPLFMQVSAARNAMNGSSLTERWMQLACEFMSQACLEQYLVFGARGTDALDEAFAWGYKNDASNNEDGDLASNAHHGNEINQMFEDEEYETEVDGWLDTKADYLKQLFPAVERDGRSDATSIHDSEFLVVHLEAAAADSPIFAFENSILKFLEALSKSIPEPVLVQLEHGKLEGLTEQQTHEFLVQCGVEGGLIQSRPLTNGSQSEDVI